MERVKATVVATKEADVRPYIPRGRFTGVIVTEVIDVRHSFSEIAVRFTARFEDGQENALVFKEISPDE